MKNERHAKWNDKLVQVTIQEFATCFEQVHPQPECEEVQHAVILTSDTTLNVILKNPVNQLTGLTENELFSIIKTCSFFCFHFIYLSFLPFEQCNMRSVGADYMGKISYQDSMREQMVISNPNTTGLKAPGM